MMRQNPASRAFVLAAGLVLASVTLAAAGAPDAEADAPAAQVTAVEAPAAEPPPPEKPFMPTMYVGPGFGVADQDTTEFAWQIAALARPLRWLGLQIEYLNLGESSTSRGDHDGVYFGVMPMWPVLRRLDLYAQVGLVVGDPGDDVAAGGGVLYQIPIDWLVRNNVDVALRFDYKYLNWADGDHLATFGFLLGFHK
jgi:hypothetical protein